MSARTPPLSVQTNPLFTGHIYSLKLCCSIGEICILTDNSGPVKQNVVRLPYAIKRVPQLWIDNLLYNFVLLSAETVFDTADCTGSPIVLSLPILFLHSSLVAYCLQMFGSGREEPEERPEW